MPPDEPAAYIDESPSSARVIEAVATSVAAFVGYTEKGPVHEPVQVFSISDFEREFGSITASDTSAAIAHFFMNGGPTAWIVRVIGKNNETTPTAEELIGSEADGTGMYALHSVDLFNLLLIPAATNPDAHNAMVAYAVQRRAFAILDIPPSVATMAQAQAWIATAPKSANAAAYFPRLLFADLARPGQRRALPSSGALAGVYARTDAQRGVWKAPAGPEAGIRGTFGPETPMSDSENGALNPMGLNALRNFPMTGVVAWGARTLVGADNLASEWKYVPVRRTALMIEESLSRGLQWVVFERNDESLWARIRLNVGTFMHSLFRQGAFQGTTASQAYFVRCDTATTTAADIALGIVNSHVGFAPLKPAEFIVLRFSLVAQAE